MDSTTYQVISIIMSIVGIIASAGVAITLWLYGDLKDRFNSHVKETSVKLVELDHKKTNNELCDEVHATAEKKLDEAMKRYEKFEYALATIIRRLDRMELCLTIIARSSGFELPKLNDKDEGMDFIHG